ncbi:hypothetical protein ILUMI_25666 [Ignelater luminosus]|uniref:Uncharacterized protein n=1 Tax=Ignelater luminosus TaxID=2038154 RepID=A0A8K0FZQ3_IGNLU|nr:hypothetical protein ILUMI_25666 [Ignelater luminosus]
MNQIMSDVCYDSLSGIIRRDGEKQNLKPGKNKRIESYEVNACTVYRCTEKVSEDERKIICQKYWILASYERKKDFILYNVLNKDELRHFKGTDKRGRKPPSNKTKEEVAAKVRAHIDSFSSVESHYTHKSTQKKYLDNTLSITKMYDLYKKECREKGDTEIKDQYLTCAKYHQATAEAKVGLEEDLPSDSAVRDVLPEADILDCDLEEQA